ncbi:MAG: biosynthetic-type acetolactate synthase large subunit [Candidatus Auribacter fodinae]|jgi:acetolactate synthase-1/2/3 large subunit|uniref:Acetolactate synthase n=1 Tax=Candidatus Auribacter fodinae TaxID=2093366 RepID=A0A3A4QWL1_9BACT|nr:MAG: biosynthetic-type acetolactate synthase large subunit [Candidatus Auribacter fodinae]
MKMNGAEITISFLESRGIECIAGIPGGANLPLYDALHKSSIRHILARHEQGAGFIAQGMARSTGKPAVCFATSGPGATNLITAIADAKLDSIPVIGITGQVPTSLIGTDAFQEVDTYGMTLPITKHNFLVRSAEELITVLPEAFRIAASGRPGPVIVDIPKNVQCEHIEFAGWQKEKTKPAAEHKINDLPEADIKHIAEMINKSKKPVLYVGGGIIHSDAESVLIDLARRSSIPVATTLMGLGCFPADDPLYIGMLGMHGARYTNYILSEADLLLAFGVRFDDRATGKVEEFCPNASIIHIDIDRSEIDKIKKSNIALESDIADAMTAMLPHIKNNAREAWIARVEQLRDEYGFKMPFSADPLNPLNLVKHIAELSPKNSIITTDVGQHQMWVAQIYPFSLPRTLLTSGGLGTMGFGLPAAIGAALANPDKRVVCVSGDGSFLMNIQELATLADLGLNVTVIIMNNGHLGLVRQQQELFYKENYIASRFQSNPDFAAISRNFGIRSYDLGDESEPLAALGSALCVEGPCVVNAPIHFAENVLPMVPPGKANHEMIGG